jgi:hypothetical protein
LYRHLFIVLFAASAATTSTGVVNASPRDDATIGDPTSAIYGSETLDLAGDWGTASACVELGDITECYETDAELRAAHPEVLRAARSAGVANAAAAAAALTCSSSLRLYDGNSYTGTILYLNTRGVIHNLSNFGFDNATSSYKVGACAAGFYSLPGLAGSIYPGNTAAFAQSPTMAAGWNNVVSSVLIF